MMIGYLGIVILSDCSLIVTFVVYTDRVSSNPADLRVVTVAQLDASEPRHRKIGNLSVQASLVGQGCQTSLYCSR